MKYITPIELKELQSDSSLITILDIREPYELEICKIESLHIPMAEVPGRVGEVPESGEVVVMCRSGKRALAVANYLESDHNRDNISVLDGGILAWIEQIDNQMEAY